MRIKAVVESFVQELKSALEAEILWMRGSAKLQREKAELTRREVCYLTSYASAFINIVRI